MRTGAAARQKQTAALKAKSLERLIDFTHTGRATCEVERIVPAAIHGLVETLFVDPRAAEFGRYRPDTNRVEFTTERNPTLDLVERATSQTILHRGTVYAAASGELPNGRSMGAVLRF